MRISHSHKRLIIIFSTVFFIISTYLCAKRLSSSMSYITHIPEKPKEDSDGGNGNGNGNGSGSGSRKKPKPPGYIELNEADLPMSYGNYDRPALHDLHLVRNIDTNLIPTLENGRRLVIVGDIHGMDTTLEALLTKVHFDTQSDHLIAVGDMINKGPDSPAVVSRLINLQASAVRGNHEDRVLLSLAEQDSHKGANADTDLTIFWDSRGQRGDLATARSLSRAHIDWLSSLPVILTLDPLPIIVCHAGLVPGLLLEKQDPWAVMNLRTLVYPREEIRKDQGEEPRLSFSEQARQADPPTTPNLDTDADSPTPPEPFDRAVAVPVSTREGERWSDVWTAHQKRLPKSQRRTVVYGHDAKSGYRETKYTFGIDSGCSKGNVLTALVIEAAPKGGFKHLTYQVNCEGAEGL